MIPKRREPCVLFLDDGFDCPDSFNLLTAAGFDVRRFQDCFTGPDGKRLQRIPDTAVIDLCSQNGWLLVTLDPNMERMHREHIRTTQVAILATANNNDGVQPWVKAIRKARPQIERDFKKQERPYVSRLSREGKITKTDTIR